MKTKILIIAVLLVSIAMFSTGAYAYFTSERTITGSSISTGVLDLQLKNDCRGDNTAAWGTTASAWNFSGMVPGEYVEQTICFKNDGNVDAGRVWYDWTSLMETPAGQNFAKQLIIVDVRDNDDGANQVAVFNGIGVRTLYDLAAMDSQSVYSATSVYPYLPAHSDDAWMYMKLQFDPNAGNEYMGITLTYNLTLKAVQKLPGNQ